MDLTLELEALRRAEGVVRRHFAPTPVLTAPRLAARVGAAEVILKLDIATPIRTFKLRGALNKIETLEAAGAAGGVVTASAGNHGLAVAWAARAAGRPAVICVPEGANPQKVAAIAATGARVVQHGVDYQAAFEHCVELGRREGLHLVHAYDDPAVIAGQGTVGLELAAQLPEPVDAVLVGVGGGGLISGLAVALKHLWPGVRVIGVQPEGADSMARSLAAGCIAALDQVRTIADGLGARHPGQWTFALSRRYVDEVVRVSDDDLWAAMAVLLQEERQVVEPAGAAGTAALLRYGAARFGRRVAVVLSGANIADAVLARVLQMAQPGGQ